ncbi:MULTISPECIES: hypothetical protein [Thermococcus]|uniref:MIP18 family-like domain-containing protein n=1 Tax=Thermococcus nautili TaxID=195522 RepID=W8PK41_9EURY|nr:MULTISPECIES: hypothetical protein [Thermococcus]AHL22459.1 hypothetical protein BD01_0837 [Thermococcus nautili]NJE48293.1 hypothetical protein [Thermococcus sp. 9N3]CAI1493494.1 conserved protein of unknown function [Thermococcus nautili]
MREEEIYARLRKVKEPLTGEDIVGLNLVHVKADEDGVVIYLRLTEGLSHPFQHALSWPVQRRIVEEIVKALSDVPNLEILDMRTLQRYYPEDEDDG